MRHSNSPNRFIEILLVSCLGSVALTIVVMFLTLPLVHAAPRGLVTVTNTNDSGAGSLRDAIVNALPNDTIVFSLTLPATITLSSQLEITQSLIISGPGASLLTFSGNNATRVITVTSGITLNLSSITIANGSAGFGDGGGIYNAGKANIASTSFYNNSAFRGGGMCIVAGGSAIITSTTFYSNSTGYGGGLCNKGGSVAISNTAFLSNTALGGGGGGIVNAGTLSISNGTFVSNTAMSGRGGGIYNLGTLTITNGSLFSNSATFDGGGISNSGVLSLTSLTFNGNSTEGFGPGGGGISNSSTLTISNSSFISNTTSAIYNSGTLGINNSTFISNTAWGGGAIYKGGGTLTVVNSTLYSNTVTTYGGGIYIAGSGTVNVTNSTLFGNHSAYIGGGIYNATVLTVTNSTIAGNIAAIGGGIYNDNGVATLQNTILTNNSLYNCDYSIAPITNGGNNIDSSGTCLWGSSKGSFIADPRLGPLANNGGATQTMALLPSSPAIDGVIFNAPNGCPPTDQRGFHRPVGLGCDIGAYEYYSFTLSLPLIMR